MKEKLELVKNEKSSLAKELEEVKSKLKIANKDLINFKGIENEVEQLNLKTHPLTMKSQLKWYKERTHLIPHPLTMKSKIFLCFSYSSPFIIFLISFLSLFPYFLLSISSSPSFSTSPSTMPPRTKQAAPHPSKRGHSSQASSSCRRCSSSYSSSFSTSPSPTTSHTFKPNEVNLENIHHR